jgi:hypothetical protein
MHRLPEQIAIPLGHLAGVDANADFDSALRVGGVVLLHGALDRGGGTYRCHGGRKGNKKPITQGLAHPTTERRDLLMNDRGLQSQDVVSVPVAARPPQCGRADDVGQHDRECSGATVAIRQACLPVAPLQRSCRSDYGGPECGCTAHLQRLNPRLTLEAFRLGGVGGHPKGAIGRQRLLEQLGGLLSVSATATLEQHPGPQAT